MGVDFGKLTTASMLITTAMYMLIPTLPTSLSVEFGLTPAIIAAIMCIPGATIFSLGPFCSFLTQKYRRNTVCIISICIIAATLIATSYTMDESIIAGGYKENAIILILSRGILGAFFGLSLMILNSTLIIDCCSSPKRTQANAITAWIHLLSIPLGIILGIVTKRETNIQDVFYISAGMCTIAVLLILSIRFPFKAPEETLKKVSLDRFLATNSLPFIASLLPLSVCLGLCLSNLTNIKSTTSFASGFIIAILTLLASHHKGNKNERKFSVSKNGLSRTGLAGYLLLAISVVIISQFDYMRHQGFHLILLCILGLSLTLVLSNIHLCLIEGADHCQRGSAESSYFLTLELGIYIGIFANIITGNQNLNQQTNRIAIPVLLLISAICYFFYIRRKVLSHLYE